jgi:hypothetical protein
MAAMTRYQLRLSDAQQAQIDATAASLAPSARDAFICDVTAAIDKRCRGEVPSNYDVNVAIDMALRTLWPKSVFICDAVSTKEATMPKQLQKIDWENDDNWLIVKDGTRILKVLKDGCKVSTSMMAMDAANATHQQAMFDATERQRSRNFGLKDAADLRRPGFRFQTDAAGRDARARAYQDYENSQVEAWRSPPTGAGSSGPRRGQQTGDSCTTDGRAGHLRVVDGELRCIPDGPVWGSDGTVMDERQLAYEDYERTLINSWRNPDADVSDRSVQSNDGMTMDEIYAEYDRELAASYRKVKP